MLVVAFGLVLMAAALVSERANRTVLSCSVIFLGAGFALGRGGLCWVHLGLDDPVIGRFAEVALLAILFVDGARLPVTALRQAWKLPGRALLLGMPLTVVALAAAGRWVLGMTWSEAFLVGAILSPTDPVFVTAILEHEAVPARLRRLLGIESGLNDGVALPLVVVLLEVASHHELHPWKLMFQAGLGTRHLARASQVNIFIFVARPRRRLHDGRIHRRRSQHPRIARHPHERGRTPIGRVPVVAPQLAHRSRVAE